MSHSPRLNGKMACQLKIRVTGNTQQTSYVPVTVQSCISSKFISRKGNTTYRIKEVPIKRPILRKKQTCYKTIVFGSQRFYFLIDQLQVEKVSFYFLKRYFSTRWFRISYSHDSPMSKNTFFSHLKSADFETVCDWSTSSWRNNLDTSWCNNLVCNDLDDVITLWCDVKIVTPQGHVLFTAFGKLMFEYIYFDMKSMNGF